MVRRDDDVVQAGDQTRSLAVIGAGLMGAGVAQVASLAGITVRLYDAQDGMAASAIQRIEKRLGDQVAKGRIEQDVSDGALARIAVADTLEDGVGEADAVIEAVIESLDVKQDLFARVSRAVRPGVLMATNTSALPITAISAGAERPDEVIGMHFFSPVPATRLCEIVRGYHTSAATVVRAQALAQALGKETILVSRDDPGFVTSRLITVLAQEAVRLVEEGLASPTDIDRACELAFGHRMGPLATLDLTGIDIGYRAGNGMYEQTGDARFKPPQLMARMVAAGRLGRKTGGGFFDYDDDAR